MARSLGFPEHFRAIVGPRLRRAARYEGLRVAIGETSVAAAVADLHREAWRLGASQLSDDLQRDLREHLLDWLCDAAGDALAVWDDALAMADKVARDIARWERDRAGTWPERAVP